MENRTDSSAVVGIIFIIIFIFAFISEMGFIGMIIAFALMTPYMNNFVLKPLAKNGSVKNNMPNNYMYRKLQNTRLVIWIISAILGFSIIFLIEMIAMAISIAKINRIKQELGIPTNSFSKNDYLIYDEYSKFSKDNEYNECEDEENDDDYTIREYSYDDAIDDREEKLKKEIEAIKNELYKNISEEPILKEAQKFDFNNPVGDIPKVEPIKTNISSIWDEPIGSNSDGFNSKENEKTQPSEDEICCEKCGTIMSKMKIACPKCGALVKNSYRSRK